MFFISTFVQIDWKGKHSQSKFSLSLKNNEVEDEATLGWDTNMKIKKILMIGMIIGILLFATFVPIPISIVKAATTDTIVITFDPEGNISIDVWPETFNFSTFWSDSREHTGGTYFTIWNNGSVDNMVTDINTTSTTEEGDLTLDEDSVPTADDGFALYLAAGGTASGIENWVTAGGIELDSDLDMSGTETFGFTLYISNITANHTWQTLGVTLTGALT